MSLYGDEGIPEILAVLCQCRKIDPPNGFFIEGKEFLLYHEERQLYFIAESSIHTTGPLIGRSVIVTVLTQKEVDGRREKRILELQHRGMLKKPKDEYVPPVKTKPLEIVPMSWSEAMRFVDELEQTRPILTDDHERYQWVLEEIQRVTRSRYATDDPSLKTAYKAYYMKLKREKNLLKKDGK